MADLVGDEWGEKTGTTIPRRSTLQYIRPPTQEKRHPGPSHPRAYSPAQRLRTQKAGFLRDRGD